MALFLGLKVDATEWYITLSQQRSNCFRNIRFCIDFWGDGFESRRLFFRLMAEGLNPKGSLMTISYIESPLRMTQNIHIFTWRAANGVISVQNHTFLGSEGPVRAHTNIF